MELNLLQGIKLAVLGGDKREVEMMKNLLALGAKVKVLGNPGAELGVEIVDNLADAITEAQVIIAPMTGTDETGKIKSTFVSFPLMLFSEELFAAISPGTLFFIGVAKEQLKKLAGKYQVKLLEMATSDEIAILNAIPTAEGAIQIAMEKLPITIHGSRVIILGFGRVGMTLARMLNGIGAKTIAVSRQLAELARAKEMSLEILDLKDLEQKIGEAQIIYNTIPALVLTKELLRKAQPEVLIIDLASQPGGTDFATAEKLGLQALLASGLPGKVAPKTAGRILGEMIPQLIKANLQASK